MIGNPRTKRIFEHSTTWDGDAAQNRNSKSEPEIQQQQQQQQQRRRRVKCPISVPRWETMLALLAEQEKGWGSMNIPLSHTVLGADGTEIRLGLWLGTQRQAFRKGKLNSDKLRKLQAFVDAGRLEWGQEKAAADDKQWDYMFSLLLEFGEHYGHCNVPERYCHPVKEEVKNTPAENARFKKLREAAAAAAAASAANANAAALSASVGTGHRSALFAKDELAAGHGVERGGVGLGGAGGGEEKMVEGGVAKLGRWLHRQRTLMKRGTIKADRLTRLQELCAAGKLFDLGASLVVRSQKMAERGGATDPTAEAPARARKRTRRGKPSAVPTNSTQSHGLNVGFGPSYLGPGYFSAAGGGLCGAEEAMSHYSALSASASAASHSYYNDNNYYDQENNNNSNNKHNNFYDYPGQHRYYDTALFDNFCEDLTEIGEVDSSYPAEEGEAEEGQENGFHSMYHGARHDVSGGAPPLSLPISSSSISSSSSSLPCVNSPQQHMHRLYQMQLQEPGQSGGTFGVRDQLSQSNPSYAPMSASSGASSSSSFRGSFPPVHGPLPGSLPCSRSRPPFNGTQMVEYEEGEEEEEESVGESLADSDLGDFGELEMEEAVQVKPESGGGQVDFVSVKEGEDKKGSMLYIKEEKAEEEEEWNLDTQGVERERGWTVIEAMIEAMQSGIDFVQNGVQYMLPLTNPTSSSSSSSSSSWHSSNSSSSSTSSFTDNPMSTVEALPPPAAAVVAADPPLSLLFPAPVVSAGAAAAAYPNNSMSNNPPLPSPRSSSSSSSILPLLLPPFVAAAAEAAQQVFLAAVSSVCSSPLSCEMTARCKELESIAEEEDEKEKQQFPPRIRKSDPYNRKDREAHSGNVEERTGKVGGNQMREEEEEEEEEENDEREDNLAVGTADASMDANDFEWMVNALQPSRVSTPSNQML